MRYSDEELNHIKGVFSENEELLKVIRKVMLQIPLNSIDQSLLTFLKGDILKIIRKTFLPTIEPEAPFHQIVDLWLTLNVNEKDPFQAWHSIKAREMLIEYIDQQLRFLEGDKRKPKIVFESLTDFSGITQSQADKAFINLMVRNTLLQHTEMQISMLLMLAGLKNETVEETQKRLQKNSSK